MSCGLAVAEFQVEGANMTDEADVTVANRLSKVSMALAALSAGLALGAVALSGYAFHIRMPEGLISDRLAPVTSLLAWSLAVVIVIALFMIYHVIRIAIGKPQPGVVAWLLAAASVVTAWLYLNSDPAARAQLIEGPGSHPAFGVSRLSWLVLTIGVAVLLAGAVYARDRQTPLPWIALGSATAVGLVVALVAGLGVVALSDNTSVPPTAAPIAIPELPTAVGTAIAYSVTTHRADWVLPAGPGFVVVADHAIIGHDGVTGVERWRFPVERLPSGCTLYSVKSTGTTPESMVLAECRRTLIHAPTIGSTKDGEASFLVGIDAMTGAVLWSSDNNWTLQGPAVLPSGVAPVQRSDDIAALDPRTGALRWKQPIVEDARCSSAPTIVVLPKAFAYVAQCKNTATMHVLDAVTGADRGIDLGFTTVDPSERYLGVVAAYRNIVLLDARGKDTHATLRVDIDSGHVENTPDDLDAYHLNSVRDGQYPGPVVQLRDSRETVVYRVADGSALRVPGVQGLSWSQTVLQYTAQTWVTVGDQIVTTKAQDPAHNRLLVTVNADGASTSRPSPCGNDAGGLVPVPGALLILCQRGDLDNRQGIDVLGLR